MHHFSALFSMGLNMSQSTLHQYAFPMSFIKTIDL